VKRIYIIAIIIGVISAGIGIFLVEWFDENVVNPRVWKDWSCSQMREFAIAGEDQRQFTDFQRSLFHEDLSECMGR